MTNFEWKSFLKDFIRVLNAGDHNPNFRAKARQLFSKESGASEEEILRAEKRLGIKLHHTYRTFLQVSNGWPAMEAASPGQLWPADQIQWLREQSPQTVKTWADGEVDITPEEHMYYRDTQPDACWYRKAYLENTLAISDYGDASILLLSPEVIDEDGEWECWHLASWYPGAARYPSFAAWLAYSYRFHIETLNEELEIEWHSPFQ
jgi:hypothetical protein